MAHDKNGVAVHRGDKVKVEGGHVHHVHGVITDDGQVHGGKLEDIAIAKFVALAKDIEVVEKGPKKDEPEYGPGCIVWGDGPPPPV